MSRKVYMLVFAILLTACSINSPKNANKLESDKINKPNKQENVTRLEHLNGDLYQAYIVKDSLEMPYVTVSSKTGYFHG